MPATLKRLTPAELASLEHAFAADPGSDAFRPLAEAYLAMGRFMEAMVVCKKGVKAHPDDPSAKVLLARVYAEQGKDRKALEELDAALRTHPTDAAANRLAAILHLKLGEADAGAAALRRAAEAAPADPEIQELLRKHGVEPTAAAARAPEPKPRALAEGIPVAPRVASGGGAAPVRAQPNPAASAAPAPSAHPERSGRVAGAESRDAGSGGAPPHGAVPAPAAPAAKRGADRNLAYAEELAERYATKEYRLPSGQTGEIPLKRRSVSKGTFRTTFVLALVLAAGLGGWYTVSLVRKQRAVEIDRLLKETRELLDKDTYASYRQAGKLCEQILSKDSDSLAGHAFLAYVDAMRWGEHGDPETFREEAKKHLAAAKRVSATHSHVIAADVYLRYYAGDARGAIDELQRVLKGPDGGTSGLLYGVLGVVQMQSGDLDGAKESLSIAQRLAPGDVRVSQMLAEQYRRRGAGYELQAGALYDLSLRLSPDHVPSLLGKALLLVHQEQLDEAMKRVQRVLDMGDGASPRQVALASVVRGSILYAKGKAQEGATAEQQGLVLDPSNADLHDLVGRRKLRDGDPSGAIDEIQKAITLDPQRVGFYVELVTAMLRREGGAKQAVETLKAASARFSGNARIVKLLGDAHRADGDADRARAEYERALSMEKRYPDAHVALARVYRDRGEYPKALEELDRAVKEYGESTAATGAAQAFVEMAEIEEARGARGPAEEQALRSKVNGLYIKALKADAANCAALWYLGKQAADRRIRDDGRQMLGDYARFCPRGAHAGEAARIAASLR